MFIVFHQKINKLWNTSSSIDVSSEEYVTHLITFFNPARHFRIKILIEQPKEPPNQNKTTQPTDKYKFSHTHLSLFISICIYILEVTYKKYKTITTTALVFYSRVRVFYYSLELRNHLLAVIYNFCPLFVFQIVLNARNIMQFLILLYSSIPLLSIFR